jgi:hypothetical protein
MIGTNGLGGRHRGRPASAFFVAMWTISPVCARALPAIVGGMRTRAAIAILVLAASLASACDPPPLPDPDRSPVVYHSLRPRPTTTQMKAALLTAEELPGGGYRPQDAGGNPLGNVSTSDDNPFGACAASAVPRASASADPSRSPVEVVSVQAAYQKGLTGVSETITLSDAQTANDSVDAFVSALAECDRFELGPVEMRMARLDFDQVGDSSAAFRFSALMGFVTVYGHLVVVQYADLLITVTSAGAAEIDVEETRALVELALAKVHDRLPRV